MNLRISGETALFAVSLFLSPGFMLFVNSVKQSEGTVSLFSVNERKEHFLNLSLGL